MSAESNTTETTPATTPEAAPAQIDHGDDWSAWNKAAEAALDGKPSEPEADPVVVPDPVPQPATETAAKEESEPEATLEPRELTTKDWKAFSHQKSTFKKQREEAQAQQAERDAEYEKFRADRDAEQKALDAGDFDEFMQKRFGHSFNEATARYADSLNGMSAEVRRELAANRKFREETEARETKTTKERESQASAQREESELQTLSKALDGGGFGPAAKHFAKHRAFIATVYRGFKASHTGEESPEVMRGQLNDALHSALEQVRAQEKLYKNIPWEQAPDVKPEAELSSILSASVASGTTSAQPARAKKARTKTLSNTAAEAPPKQKLLSEMTDEEFNAESQRLFSQATG